MFGAQKPIVFNFLFGAAVAWIVARRLLEERLRSPLLTAVPLLSLGAYFALPGGNGLPQSLALFGFFIFVVHGTSLFGLLRTRAAKVLGTISYSIYLTHCISLFVTVHAVDRLVPIRTVDGGDYWLLAALAAAAGAALGRHLSLRRAPPSSIPNRPASRSGRKPRRSYESPGHLPMARLITGGCAPVPGIERKGERFASLSRRVCGSRAGGTSTRCRVVKVPPRLVCTDRPRMRPASTRSASALR